MSLRPENPSVRAQGYETSRPDVQRLVPSSARNILELGCSTGALGAAIKARQQANVLGVELDSYYSVDAEKILDRVVTTDAESFCRDSKPEDA